MAIISFEPMVEETLGFGYVVTSRNFLTKEQFHALLADMEKEGENNEQTKSK